MEEGKKNIPLMPIALIYNAYNQLKLLRKINPDHMILHDWREARIFLLEFEAEQHFKPDLEIRFTGLVDRHLTRLHDHLETLGFITHSSQDNEHALETFNSFSEMIDFSSFLTHYKIIIDIHITLSDILLIKSQLSKTPFNALFQGLEAITCISKMYNYIKKLIGLRPEYTHDFILTLFHLLGIRSDILWRFFAIPKINSDPYFRQKIKDLAIRFHLDLNQATDFYLICLFGHFDQENLTNPNSSVSNFWIQLDPGTIADHIKKNDQHIHEGLEHDRYRLETLTRLE